MFRTTLYSRSPIFVQEALITFRALSRAWLREGKAFMTLTAEIGQTQRYGTAELARYHEQRLTKLLRQACNHVPYFREQIKKLGISGQEVSAATLTALPLLDKGTIIQGGERHFLANNAHKPIFKGNTSGTTGAPLTLYQDLAAINRENAFIRRQLQWAGYRPGNKIAWFRGDMIVPAQVSEPPFWRRNYAEKMLMLSSYHLSERHAPAYLDALARHDPVVIQAYPSSIAFLAAYLDAHGQTFAGNSLKGIVTSSESLGAKQREMIEARFGGQVFDWYGQFERVAAIGTCEHRRYHLMSDYSYLELLPAGDDLFEIVGSGYNNFVMPLIRYRTGDLVEMDQKSGPCPCGRTFPVVKRILGRNDDFVKLPDGRQIGRLDHVFKGVVGILEAQIIQNSLSELAILIVPGPGYREKVEAQILSNVRYRLGNQIHIRIQCVEKIERTRNGKFRNVVCQI
jgi:phenylacetate-CoA ligase